MILVVLVFLGGMLTILSPCILPVLPFVFARAEPPFLKAGLPLLGGMAYFIDALGRVRAHHFGEGDYDGSERIIRQLLIESGASDEPVLFRVTLDGEIPAASHGVDVDAGGTGVIREQRLYQLIRQPGSVTEHTFTIEFLDPGAQAYAFTFG
jgi:hypothetical protein